jgi:hypothetical protein
VLLADAGLSREQIRGLDMEWVVGVVLVQRDKHGQPTFLQDESKPTPAARPGDIFRRALRLRGWPSHRIEEQVELLLKRQQELQAKMWEVPSGRFGNTPGNVSVKPP